MNLKPVLLAAGCAALLASACNPSARDPRGAVIKFLRAVRTADTVAILRGFTVEAPYTLVPDTGLGTTGPRADTIMAGRLLQELLPGGTIHARWLAGRMVVGDAEAWKGDTALVELTRLDPVSGATIYNKVGVVKRHSIWQIYSFHTQDGPSL